MINKEELSALDDLISKSRFKEVITKIEIMLNDNPDNPLLLEKLGDAYKGIGDYEQAMSYHSHAYQLNHDNNQLRDKLMEDIHQKGDADEIKKAQRMKEKKELSDYFPFLEKWFKKK